MNFESSERCKTLWGANISAKSKLTLEHTMVLHSSTESSSKVKSFWWRNQEREGVIRFSYFAFSDIAQVRWINKRILQPEPTYSSIFAMVGIASFSAGP